MRPVRLLHASPVLLAFLLAACGGGSDDPDPTPLNASLVVSGASNTALNGTYSTTTLNLSEVTKVNPIGGEPEVCSFRFAGLQQVGSNRLMDGDIRYLPGTNALRVVFVSISGLEFNSRVPDNAQVDRPNNEVDFTGKSLTATVGGTATMVLTGSMPMRSGRPEGC